MGAASRIDFNTGPYFPRSIIFLGVLILLPGIFIAKIHILATLPFWLISVIIFTTYNGLELDRTRNLYREYVGMLGMKWGTWQPFAAPEYIFIKRNKVSQTMRGRISSSTMHTEEYTGFLRFSEENKIRLAATRDKATLLEKLNPIAAGLQLDILDYTADNPSSP